MISQHDLIETISRRHPTIIVSPCSEFYKDGEPDAGVNLRAGTDYEDVDTPVISVTPYSPGYEAGISVAFLMWLVSVGWWHECNDYGSYQLYPLDSDEEADAMFERLYS